MKKLVLFILIKLLIVNAFAQSDADELKYLIASSQYTKVITETKELLAKEPGNATIFYLQSIAYKLSFKYNEAGNSIKKAIQLDSTNIEYWAEYATILLKRDREKEAKQVLEKVMKQDPVHFNAGVELANIYLKEKEYEKAYINLFNLYSNDTVNSYLARNLGLCSIKRKDKHNSVKWLLRAIELDSTDIKAYELIALVYTSLEEFDLAIDFLNRAVLYDTENVDLYKRIGDIHVMRNHNYRAIPVYLKAYELDKKDPVIIKNIGICYYKIKKYDEAIKFFKLAQPLSEDSQVYSYLGNAFGNTGQYDSAVVCYNRALELLQPDNNSIFNVLNRKANSLYNLDKYKEAIETYKLAFNTNINDTWVSYYKNKVLIDIASIYRDKLNEKKLAIDYYQKVSKPEIVINKNYYDFAQQQIKELKEELFFEGDL